MAADDEGGAESILRERENFGETYTWAKAYAVPVSERCPDGVRYSMNYWQDEPDEGTDDEGTIFRYDNYPDHLGAPLHHKRVGEAIEPVDSSGV
ncbi:hypothetical protein BRC86_08920 [Halobacteriales archaeon QS_3_64_16]|nr:MAG: hypothetical protein BRC86_08920 [Halobacteriales archaeon QS_3_64_16]